MAVKVTKLGMWALMLLFSCPVACESSSDADEGEGDTGNDEENEGEGDNPFRPSDLEDISTRLADEVAGQGDPENTQIAVVANLLADFWTPNQIGIGRAASEIGCLAVFGAPPNGDLQEQLDMVQNRIDTGYDGIAVSPIDPAEMEPLIEAAADADINVITFDSDGIPGSLREMYVGTINYSAGLMAGKTMAELLNNTGKVAAFAGAFTEDNNASERYAGVEAAFAGTDIELLPPYEDAVDFEVARANVAQAMEEHSDLAGIISIWSYNGPVAAAAVEEAGKVGEIKIVAFDLEPETIAYLESGIIDAAIGQRPYWMGYLDVYILYAMAAIGAEETKTLLDDWFVGDERDIIDTGIDVVTGHNLDLYRSYLESLGISSS